jgi:hypothetical protein
MEISTQYQKKLWQQKQGDDKEDATENNGGMLRRNCGGAKRDRTADLLNAIQALSQLSYSPSKRRP